MSDNVHCKADCTVRLNWHGLSARLARRQMKRLAQYLGRFSAPRVMPWNPAHPAQYEKRTAKLANVTVLIVEDEALVRMSAVQMIEDAGFEAVEAANADEAIAVLESQSDVAAVFTDINMPGSIDGLKLAHA